MKHFTPKPGTRHARAVVASFLAYLLLAGQVAPLALAAGAPSTRPGASAPAGDAGAGKEQTLQALPAPVPAALVPDITATKTDSFSDPEMDGKADPGQEISYEVTVANGGTDSSSLDFTDTIDPNTTLVPGSVTMSPLARNDTYAGGADTQLAVNAASGVLANDSGLPAPAVGGVTGCADTTAPFECSTTGGGTLSLAADGSFTYDPPAGFNGSDSFTYTATNSNAPDDTATATIGVDAAPTVTATTPADNATQVANNTDITVTFSEPVDVTGSWFTISCATSGAHTAAVSGGPTTFTLNPDTDFANGELCTVTVLAAQVADQDTNDPPDNMAADFVFDFTIDTPPAVTATTPTNGATAVATNANITVTFDEAVNAAAGAFSISCTVSGAHTFALSGGPTTYTLNPDVDFGGGETCTVTVIAANVTDQDAGDPPDNMAANFVFSFTTDAAPSVTATSPTNGATDVAGNTDITVTFSEPVNAASNAFTISCATSGAHTAAVSGGPTTFTLNPDTDFAGGELCTVTVVAANVTDQDGDDPPDTMAANFVFSFTIDQAPSVTATSPTNGATQVANNTNITVTFSEDVNFSASSFTINCATSGAHTAAVSGGPTTFTLNPDTDFANGELCTVTILAAQVTDTDANDPPNNMAADFVFSFTIDNPPTVTSTSPTNGATGVAANTNITINFSEPVNATTASFQIECPTPGNTQAFTLSASPSNSFTLDPTANLPIGVICTVTVVAAQITDQDTGDPPDQMETDFVFTFAIPPDAVADARNATGNIQIVTTGRSNFSVLTNDIGPGITVTAFDAVSARGGQVSVGAAGTFSYNPPAGYEGTDAFNYTITNAAGSDTATVTITIAGMIWFVNSSAAACTTNNNICGRLTNPFSTLAAFEAANGNATPTNGSDVIAPEAGDHLFIHTGAGSYNSSLTLESNQRVVGQGASSSVSALTAITPATDSDALPSTGGANPIITNSGGGGIALAQNNRLHGLTVQNTTGTGLSGNGFGTLTVSENVILSNTTTAGVPVNLNNGTLAATFRSISAGNTTADPDPVNGIVLTNTTGSFTVDGDGANTSVGGNASGGTIRNASGADGATAGNGVFLNNATNITLRRMTITGTNQNHGVRGINVNGFTLEFSTVSGTNGNSAALDEGSVNFDNLHGSAAITSCVIEGGFEDNLNVVNTSGTLNRLVITGSTFGFNNMVSGNNNLLIESQNAGTTLNWTLQSSLIKGARADWINASNNSGSTMDAVVGGSTAGLGNTFDNLGANAHPGAAAGGNRVVFGSIGNQTVDIRNNTMQGSKGEAIRLRGTASGTTTGTVNGRVRNNTVGVAATANSGSSEGSGIFIFGDGGSDMNVAVTDNTVRQYNNHGIRVDFGDEINDGSVFNVTVTGNTIANPGTLLTDFNGFHLNNGTVAATDNFTTCLNLSGNTLTGSGKGTISPNNQEFRLRQRQATTVRLPGYAGPNNNNAQVVNFIRGQNTVTPGQGDASNTVPTGGGYVGGAACTQPSFSAPETFDTGSASKASGWQANVTANHALSEGAAPEAASAEAAEPARVWSDMPAVVISAPQSGPAAEREKTDEADAEQAGAQPESDSAAPPKPARRQPRVTRTETYRPKAADQPAPPEQPELRDISYFGPLGSAPSRAPRFARASFTAAGERSVTTKATRTPPAEKAPQPAAKARARTAPVAASGETVNVTIGTMPAGKSVVIRFRVTVDSPFTGANEEVSNQGLVTDGMGGTINVLTDDPSVGGATDPTVTLIAAPVEISVRDARVTEPSTPGNFADMLFTVTLSRAPTSTVSVDFATADGTATGGGGADDDYVPTSGTLNFAAGQRVQTIAVPVRGNAGAEADETFTVGLSNPSGGVIGDGTATGTITETPEPPGTALISEVRTSGPGGAGDDFVEVYNNTDSPVTVAASDSSAGWALYKRGADCNATPVLVATIPNGTVIPARGHFLIVGSQYSLANYGGTGAAAGDLTLSSDLETDANVGLFSTADVSNLSVLTRLDAVGFGTNTGNNCSLLREGSNLGPAAGSTLEHSYFRKLCDFQPGSGCVTPGTPKDTGDNSADFTFGDTQGTQIVGTGQRLAAPGPENLASPRKTDLVSSLLLDSSAGGPAPPNRVRDLTPGNPSFAANGTMSIRRRLVNNTGAPVTRLRFRISEMTTFPAAPGQADLRAISSMAVGGVLITGDPGTCGDELGPAACIVTVGGTTLEQPPTQSVGGGLNATLTVTLGTPLAAGASVNVQFLLGVQTPGLFRFLVVSEALP